MIKSTIDSMEGMDTINVENIPSDNIRNILKGINREIEKLQQDRQMILSELERRGEKI